MKGQPSDLVLHGMWLMCVCLMACGRSGCATSQQPWIRVRRHQ